MVPGGWINYHIHYRNQGNGAVVVSWLRLLAFNIAAMLRSSLPTHDGGQLTPWRRVCDLIFVAFFRFGALVGV